MTSRNIDNTKTVLVAPLNWGLGHATRCVPIIRELLTLRIRVMIAADGPVAALLTEEFPGITVLPLKSFNIKYTTSKKWFFLNMLWQFPPALLSVYRENRWLNKTMAHYPIDAVIADNRMGLSHKKIPCIYITHQLHIKTGLGKWMDKRAQQLHYFFINRFSECWIPDFTDQMNLAGLLSHPIKKPKTPVKYIGALSRLEKSANSVHQYDYLIILSGPEPQRSILERRLLEQVEHVHGKILFIRGIPGLSKNINSSPGITIINHLPAEALNKAMQAASLIISRCGYTTIMDLVKLNKKAILIPTPGQPEQEYLAQYLLVNKLFYTVEQDRFNLKKAIDTANTFNNSSAEFPSMELYKNNVLAFSQLL